MAEVISADLQTKVCVECEQEKPLDEFYKHPHDSKGRQPRCKPCHQQMNKEIYQRVRAKVLNYLTDNNPECDICGNSDVRILQVDHIKGGGSKEYKGIGSQRLCRRILKMPIVEALTKYRVLCPNCNQLRKLEMSGVIEYDDKDTYNNLRWNVLSCLSEDDEPSCTGCGCGDIRVLQIDHIHGDGAQERKVLGGSTTLYRKILKMSKPQVRKQYQVLCANCNWIKRVERREY